MKKVIVYVVCSLLFVASQPAYSYVRLPHLIGDGMVLQRNDSVRVWGWGSSGERVVIRFLGRTDSTTTGSDGKWEIMLPPMKAGGPYSMEIDGMNHIVLNNILIGDVWVCSGPIEHGASYGESCLEISGSDCSFR